MAKLGNLKRCTLLSILAYLLYQYHSIYTYTNNHNDKESSAIGSSLTGFEGLQSPNRLHDVDNIPRLANKAANQRNVQKALKSHSEPTYSNPLDRDFSRIPGYLKGSSNSSLFGYVMRDLSNRFLLPSSDQQKRRQPILRHSSPSNILVVCPGANELLSEIKEKNITTIAFKQKLIKNFGYRIGESFLVESIFNGHNAIGVDSKTGISDNYGFNESNIFLAVFDPDQGEEDSVISSSVKEYIRSGTIQFATFRISNSYPISPLPEDWSDTVHMKGIEVAKVFLDSGYKLQVLSSSHAPTDGLNPYGPNKLLKNIEEVESFLRFGAGLAQNTEEIRYARSGYNNSTTSPNKTDVPTIFHSILFATRGLDLAIPTRKAFLNLTGYGSDHVLDVKKDGIPYLHCPASSTAATIRFRNGRDANLDENIDNGDEIVMSCFGRRISIHEALKRRIVDGNDMITVDLWHSHKNISLSEAACLKCTKTTMEYDNKKTIDHVCTNRILTRVKKNPSDSLNQTMSYSRRRNLLAIELKGVNQKMLDSSFTHLKQISRYLGLEYFPNYFHSTTIRNGDNDQELWASWSNNVVEENAYQRYRGTNQCEILSSSSDNNHMSYHGSQIGRMFCFDYDRPNCLGGKHAASHLFNHVGKFVKKCRKENERWTSSITLVDGVEETQTLAGALDLPFSAFLFELKASMSFEEWSDTVIAIYSNDVQDPVLFLKANENEMTLLKGRKAVFTSDLHHMIRSTTTITNIENTSHTDLAPEHVTTIGSSDEAGGLPAPPSILSFYADIPKEHKFQLIKPYSEQSPKRAMVVQGCRCATNTASWFQCDQHPWNNSIDDSGKETYILVDCPGNPIHLEIKLARNKDLVRRSTTKQKESASTTLNHVNIMFLELDSVSLEYADRHFPKTRELLKKYRINRNHKNEYECIYGVCSAEFPYTSLVGANSIPNQVAALSGCISSTTEELCGLINATTGDICGDTDMLHYGLRLERIRHSATMAYWCPNRDLNVTKTPWLFGVSDSKGYINFFGEEFCYDNSPYVTQGNVFPKFYQDIQSHYVFCDLADRKIIKESLKLHAKNKWGVDISDPCFEGYACSENAEKSKISLEFMEQMWNVYANYPKLAFLNAMAAHDYSPDVIIIRSDHGLQKGPMSMDYALQVEHRHPWAEILVPQNLVVSKSALFMNQGRMLTGFDLYRTMRFLMSDRAGTRSLESGIPDWSFDILAEEIPQNRTCEEAKVDPNLCRSAKQTRQYGVCNRFDSSQVRFC